MKLALVVCAVVAAALAEETYDTKYDNFNAQELVENQRLLKSYAKCFLGTGPCTPEGSDFKKTIPDALKTNCAKCSPKQRALIRTVVQGFKEKLPEDWTALIKTYDPDGAHKESFNRFLHGTD